MTFWPFLPKKKEFFNLEKNYFWLILTNILKKFSLFLGKFAQKPLVKSIKSRLNPNKLNKTHLIQKYDIENGIKSIVILENLPQNPYSFLDHDKNKIFKDFRHFYSGLKMTTCFLNSSLAQKIGFTL